MESRELTGDLRETFVQLTTLSNLLSCRFAASGEGGIRTPEGLASLLVFETSTIDHSVTSPAAVPLKQTSASVAREGAFGRLPRIGCARQTCIPFEGRYNRARNGDPP